jgi:hypothetical protein
MKIICYIKDRNCDIYTTKYIPDDGVSISLYLNSDKNDGIGSLDFCWNMGSNPTSIRLCTCSESITITQKAYLIVNDKDKFVICDKEDLMNFYKYLTDTDVTRFIKEFKSFEKEQKIKKDF